MSGPGTVENYALAVGAASQPGLSANQPIVGKEQTG